MCATCGCSPLPSEHAPRTHSHGHGEHRHAHAHPHSHPTAAVLHLEQEILGRNSRQAERNRTRLTQDRIVGVNLMGSPGAGKTALLERTAREFGGPRVLQVIEGDQETDRDAQRLLATGVSVVQLNTGTGCHLDADMVERGLKQLAPRPDSIVMIENVGNLVCPALFDLGEHARVVVASVTEGDDKPLKYPHMFRAAHLVLLNKVDLLPYVPFDQAQFVDRARQVKAQLVVLPISVQRGDGMDAWYRWLREQAPHGPA
jgi:hydrogenase nickel incorporation protein HypB